MHNTENSIINRYNLTMLLESLRERVVYICAPAGYGKTVAIRQWLEQSDTANAILSLYERDNEVTNFCKAFCSALLDCQPQNDALRKIITHPSFDNAPDEFSDHAVSALSDSQIARLVIDDLHFVSDEHSLRLLISLLNRLPESFQIVLVSRNELPTLFADLWLKGNLARITADDLRFSREDIMRLYDQRGCPIATGKADEVFRLTNGWGIAISALLLSNGDPHRESIKHLDEFIRANVWQRLDETTRGFILRTSVIGELTPSLCTALTGESDCEAILDRLVRQNVFISKNKHGVYQYHRLFSDFLHKLPELQKIQPSLLEKAGYWHLEHKDFYSAVNCFIECENQKGIIKCFVFWAAIERNNFFVDRLLPLLKLPIIHATADEFPFIYSAMAWCAFNEGRPADMTEYADRYYEKQLTVLRYDLRLAFYIIFMRLVDFRVSMQSLKQFIKKIPKPFLSAKLSGAKPSIGIINQYMPLLHRGTRDFSECAVPDAEANIAELLSVIGGLFGDEALLLAECVTAGLLYEQGQLSRAHRHALAANSEIKKHFASETKFLAMSVLAYVLEALGQREQADAHVKRMADMIEQDGAYVLSYNFSALKTRFELGEGNMASARNWLEKHLTRLYDDLDFYHFNGHLTTCRATIAIGDYDSAVILLTKALTLAESYNRPLDTLETRILLSIAYWKKKSCFQDDAMRHLEQAVSIAYGYGYTQAFINEGTELAGMLLRLQRRVEQHVGGCSAPASFIKTLHLKAQEHTNGGLTSGQPEMPSVFTDRQKEVMRLMRDGKSYREICDALSITRPTLRSHLASIYKKLGVTGETDAIKKIELLGLLDNE